MSGLHNIFISHRHADDELVGQLKNLISQTDDSVRDFSIMASFPMEASSDHEIKKVLAARIEQAGKVLVIIRPETRYHPWVDWEVEYAYKSSSKRIIGVWAPGAHKCALPGPLEKYAHAIVEWKADDILGALNGRDNWRLPDEPNAVRSSRPESLRRPGNEAPKLLSYVVGQDIGLAPNPFHGWCTLALGKPGVRAVARPGDLVLGTGAQKHHRGGRLVYCMEIEEVLTHEQYWDDPRFLPKRLVPEGDYQRAYGDNLYHRADDGQWVREPSMQHTIHQSSSGPGTVSDTRVNAVLVSRSFVYLGGSGPEIPPRFRSKYDMDLIHDRPGYRCHFPHDMVRAFAEWVRGLGHGVQGRPLNW